jgi:hypothetical protein
MGERGARRGKRHGCWPCFLRAGYCAWEEESCWRLKEMEGWECKNASTSRTGMGLTQNPKLGRAKLFSGI